MVNLKGRGRWRRWRWKWRCRWRWRARHMNYTHINKPLPLLRFKSILCVRRVKRTCAAPARITTQKFLSICSDCTYNHLLKTSLTYDMIVWTWNGGNWWFFKPTTRTHDKIFQRIHNVRGIHFYIFFYFCTITKDWNILNESLILWLIDIKKRSGRIQCFDSVSLQTIEPSAFSFKNLRKHLIVGISKQL